MYLPVCQELHVYPANPRFHRMEHRPVGPQHRVVDNLLVGGEPAIDGPAAGDVAAVGVVLRTHVKQNLTHGSETLREGSFAALLTMSPSLSG